VLLAGALPSRSSAYAVVEMNDVAFEAALAQELKLSTHVVRQRALTATHDDRAEEQMALVDQARGDRLAGELGTTDGDVRYEVSLSRRIVSASNSRSIRVLALDAV